MTTRRHGSPAASLAATGLLLAAAGVSAVLSLSGNWTGSLSSGMRDGYADLDVTMYQDGTRVSGEIACSGGTLDCHAPAAKLAGTIEGRDFTARLRFPDGHLCGLSGTLDDRTLRGEYSCNDELGNDRGSWEMTLETAGLEPTLEPTPTP